MKDKYIFVKGDGIDNLSYVYIYNIVEVKSKYINFWYIFSIALIFVIIVIVLVLLKKKEMIFKNNTIDNNPNEGLLY